MRIALAAIGIFAVLATPAFAQGKGSTGTSGVAVAPSSGQDTVTTPRPASPLPPVTGNSGVVVTPGAGKDTVNTAPSRESAPSPHH